MQTVSIPWAMWYTPDRFDLTFPDSWAITVAEMKGGPDIGDAGIRRALAEPIGAPPLREMARGRRDAVILVDDISRPTPAFRLLPYVLEELAAGGIAEEHVIVIAATGTHRPFRRQEWIKKIGLELTERLDIRSHNPTDNLEYLGRSSLNIPVWVNRDVVRADLTIGLGIIMPRGRSYGGGSKIVLPGVSGRETIAAHHSYCPSARFVEHTEEVGRMAGLDYIVNPLLNADLGIMALVAGEPIAAFARGCALGDDLYGTVVPEGMDIVICNAWPKDNDAHQISLARVPLFGTRKRVLNPGGTVVTVSASPEGTGYHLVMGPGTFFRTRTGREVGAALTGGAVAEVQARNILFCPGVNAAEVRLLYGDQYLFCKTWPQVLATLEERYGRTARVAVFPYGALQCAAE
jgi:nickel-dependent lactate racemase